MFFPGHFIYSTNVWIVQNDTKNKREMLYVTFLLEALFLLFHSSRPTHMIEILHLSENKETYLFFCMGTLSSFLIASAAIQSTWLHSSIHFLPSSPSSWPVYIFVMMHLEHKQERLLWSTYCHRGTWIGKPDNNRQENRIFFKEQGIISEFILNQTTICLWLL